MPEPANEITSLAQMVEVLVRDCANTPVWFRGQCRIEWPLTCSLARNGGPSQEMSLIRRFKQNALQIMQRQPSSEWDWWFIMQHHGLPTRLLDWSESPLVALYFAIREVCHDNTDGCLWALKPLELNRKAKLEVEDIPGFGDDDHLEQYLPINISKQKQPFSPIAALAPRNTPRILSQQGVFVVFHKDLSPLDSAEESFLWKYRIPHDKKAEIRNGLATLGIRHLSLFPELDSVALHAKDYCHE